VSKLAEIVRGIEGGLGEDAHGVLHVLDDPTSLAVVNESPRAEAGELVALLSDYQLDWVELHAVYPGGRRPSLKVPAFSDYFAAQLMHKN
jgi:DNA-binding transcriptional LysR family regulator